MKWFLKQPAVVLSCGATVEDVTTIILDHLKIAEEIKRIRTEPAFCELEPAFVAYAFMQYCILQIHNKHYSRVLHDIVIISKTTVFNNIQLSKDNR